MKTELVITRFREHLDWLKDTKFVYTIYNKGINDIDFNNIKLKNIGRDSETHLYHIVHNYNNLAEYTVFLQGKPIDHINKKLQIPYARGKYPSTWDYIIKTGDLLDMRYFIPFQDGLWGINKNQVFVRKSEAFKERIFSAGVQYVVSRKNIKFRSLDFYKNLLYSCDWQGWQPWNMEEIYPELWNTNSIHKEIDFIDELKQDHGREKELIIYGDMDYYEKYKNIPTETIINHKPENRHPYDPRFIA